MRRADGKPTQRAPVVDDEPVPLNWCRWPCATRLGYRDRHDGASAPSSLSENLPDVGALTSCLPDMSAGRPAQAARSAARFAAAAAHGQGFGRDRIAGLTAGGDDYVTKPFSLKRWYRLRHCCATGVANEAGGAQIVVVIGA